MVCNCYGYYEVTRAMLQYCDIVGDISANIAVPMIPQLGEITSTKCYTATQHQYSILYIEIRLLGVISVT